MEELQEILKGLAGQMVFLKYKRNLGSNYEKDYYTMGIISNDVNRDYVGVYEVENKPGIGQTISLMGVPISVIEFIAKDYLWWKDSKGNENVIYGTQETIDNERAKLFGKSRH